ncbi:MAG: AMP-binding protein, partial [Microthrixaceae bacterium]|nr:AMP-binding protein [Microthrixaceae bacterium]
MLSSRCQPTRTPQKFGRKFGQPNPHITASQGGTVAQESAAHDEEATGQAIESHQEESRTFPPSDEFKAQARLTDPSIYEQGEDYENFWATQARELLTWDEDFHTTLEWNLPDAKWFLGGKLNVAYNCLDRHVEAGNGDRVAIYFEGEPGDTRAITYAELLDDVKKFTRVLIDLGVKTGDRVCIYMPMIPEAAVAMLACARLGAPHTLVFGGFSPDSLIDRINDAEAVLAITADAGYRRGKPSALKVNMDLAVADCPTIRNVVVVNRCDTEVEMTDGRDLWWHDLMADAPADADPVPVDSEHLLFLLYTSGTTAKPKGVMHTTGGYMTQVAWTHREVFDLKPERDIYWCSADIGWVTGHSYIV